jgi:hypothetical protein
MGSKIPNEDLAIPRQSFGLFPTVVQSGSDPEVILDAHFIDRAASGTDKEFSPMTHASRIWMRLKCLLQGHEWKIVRGKSGTLAQGVA